MSKECALLILGSKGQGHGVFMIEHITVCNPSMIMKFHTLSPYESRMCPVDFGGKRSSWGIYALKRWFLNQSCLCNQHMIIKLYTTQWPAPHESRMCPIDFGVKSHGVFWIENSQGCSMSIQKVFATRLFASLMYPLLFLSVPLSVIPTSFLFNKHIIF